MNWHLLQGDNKDVLQGLPSDSFDTIITDPPYGLSFMGKHWDYDVPSVEIWKECLRVLKPGGTALIFAGSRTQHRMAVNVEDAGFELKDCIMWLYGSGFPKATDISKQLDKKAGVEFEQLPASGVGFMNPEGAGGYNVTKHQLKKVGESCPEAILWNGWKSHGLKPAYEPIIVAMKPNEGSYAANAMKWGVAGLNIDGGRIEGQPHHNYGRTCSGGLYTKKCDTPINTPLEGRFPANIILDEEAAQMLDEQTGVLKSGSGSIRSTPTTKEQKFAGINPQGIEISYSDSGGASRFFYCAKASKAERNAGLDKNYHPTIKPLALMEYLCTLTKTPLGGIVLDPWAGSGTTGIACLNTGRECLMIERETEYCQIIEKRMTHAEKTSK